MIARVEQQCAREGLDLARACQEMGMSQGELFALDDRMVDPGTIETINDWLATRR